MAGYNVTVEIEALAEFHFNSKALTLGHYHNRVIANQVYSFRVYLAGRLHRRPLYTRAKQNKTNKTKNALNLRAAYKGNTTNANMAPVHMRFS